MPFTITATAYLQSSTLTTNRGIVTIAAPTRATITTASVLAQLATDEHFLGNYPAATFPAGAKLVWLDYPNDFLSSHFVVNDAAGNLLCDVSGIIQFSNDQIEFAVLGGKLTTAGLLAGYTQTYVGAVNYNNQAAGGTTQIYLAGLVVASGTDTVNTASSTITEKFTAKFSNGIGSGTIGGKNFYLSGSISATGSAVFPQ